MSAHPREPKTAVQASDEFAAAAQAPRQIRIVIGAVCAILLLVVFADIWYAERELSGLRGSEKALNLAGRQRMLSQRLAYLSSRKASEGGHSRETNRILHESLEQFESERDQLLRMPVYAENRRLAALREDLISAGRMALASSTPNDATSSAHSVFMASEQFLPAMERTVQLLQERFTRERQERQSDQATRMLLLALLMIVLSTVASIWLGRRIATQNERTAALAMAAEQLALVAQRTENAVLITDRSGLVTWANAAFTKISGYAFDEIVGLKPGAILQFEQTDRGAINMMRKSIQEGKGVQVEVLNRAKSGRVYWLKLDIQPILDASGTCTGFTAVETDITPQVLERNRLAALLAVLPCGVVHQNTDGALISANAEASKILCRDHDELIRLGSEKWLWNVFKEDGTQCSEDELPTTLALRSAAPQRGAILGLGIPASSGEIRWIRVNTQPLVNEHGKVNGVVSAFHDITEASSQRRLLALTVDAAGLGTWDWSIPTGHVKMNDRWLEMLGYSRGDVAESVQTWEALTHPEDLVQARTALQQHFGDQGSPYRCELRIRRAEGTWSWILAAGAVIERSVNNEPLRMVGIHLDITARKELEAQLKHAAMTDGLTGLPNRAALKARLGQCSARARLDANYRYALLFLDFDRFKQVNDSLGHEAGDDLLRQIAQRLRAVIRPSDDLARLEYQDHTAARLGGDEFVALLEPMRRTEDAAIVAQRLLNALAAPYSVAGQEIRSSASIGIVTSEHHGGDAEAMLRDADTAMYEAKRRGRGRFVEFSADMHERVRRSLDLEADLRNALNSVGHLYAMYQPIVDLATGAMSGVEALARWQHPVRGQISPTEFIPLAEESGLIADLGEFIMEVACRQCREWQEEHGDAAPKTVSVNISRAQLRIADLPVRIARILERTGLAASSLRLEITETLAMQDAQIVAMLQALRRVGVSLALDDFGTGYSSLATLDQLPLDVVKIDRSFVERMMSSPYQTALIRATLDVAESLRLGVVAEGVETEAQAATLLAAGCQFAQGWYFGRPASAQDIASRLKSHPDLKFDRLGKVLAPTEI